MKEMGFRIARKHAAKLRVLALCLGFAIPGLGLGASMFGPAATGPVFLLAALAVMAGGIATERWLFFAEAKHSVSLYYGHT
jgi:DMSO reductase anchor subunit